MHWLQVTLDLAKGVYAKFIDWDEQMFDRETCMPAHSANYVPYYFHICEFRFFIQPIYFLVQLT